MINIQDIIPFMTKGWVAMDANGRWYWYSKKPTEAKDFLKWVSEDYNFCFISDVFDIAPAYDWTKSLIQVKGVK